MKRTGQKIAQWLALISFISMFGFVGAAEQADKLSPGLVAGSSLERESMIAEALGDLCQFCFT